VVRVVVMEDYQRAVERLECFRLTDGHEVRVHSERPATLAERAAQIGDAEALVLIRERTAVDEALLERLPHLRLICQTGRGMPHLDVDACTRRGIVVCNGGGSPYAPAELTLALMLCSARHLVADAVALREGTWQTTVGRELHGRVLGIVGYGSIGALVAVYGRALGMRVVAWGRAGSLARAREDGYEAEPELDALLERADVASLHLKLSPETRGIVDRRRLALMKPDALLVNTARAGLIEPGALVEALAAGRPGSAAIDVFDDEPAFGDPLVADPAVLATPHLGYVTWDTYEAYFGEAFAQVNAFAAGAPYGVVNPGALAARRVV
jgi:D-3-phosphoglycerate dehydrogenase / 2-oxoglutarate reductase